MAKKILVIDDEVHIVEMLQMRLEAMGYEVAGAFNGQEGLDKARSEKPDLILLDVMMPKMDGYTVCRMLKFDEKYKDIPVILLTARAQDSDHKIGQDCRADDYVTKPFDPKILVAKIEGLLK